MTQGRGVAGKGEGARDVTVLLQALNSGDHDASDALLRVVYAELHRRAAAMMMGESLGHTLQATALVHDAYLCLVKQKNVDWVGRTHFFAMSAKVMRRILVDHARRRLRHKRGGRLVRLSLREGYLLSPKQDVDVLALHQVLQRLATRDARQAQIVELRFFAGLGVEEVAQTLKVSKRTVELEWTLAKAWLRRELTRT